MSNPENPLNQYRSYSYHHILIASNSTQALRELVDDEKLNITALYNQASKRKLQDLIKEVKKNEVSAFNKDNKKTEVVGQYLMMLNSTKDVDYYIESVSWGSIMIPNSETGLGNHGVGTEGVMTIKEPNGVRFFSYLHDVFEALECDPAGVVFAIKTIFVGFPHYGNPEINAEVPQVITNVQPFIFSIYDIVNKFDEAGGTYTISFLGSSNGTANMDMLTTIPSGTNGVLIGDHTESGGAVSNGRSLTEVFASFTEHMNKQSLAAVSEYRDYVSTLQPEDVVNKQFRNRNVAYTITLASPYDKAEYVVDMLNIASLGATPNQGSLFFQPDDTIKNAIDIIMSHCSKVANEATKGIKNEVDVTEKFRYVVESFIDSKISSIDLREIKSVDALPPGLYTIAFHIRREKIQTHKEQIWSEVKDDEILKGNTIEFDYLYTGKNIDIIEFDMTMNMGFLMYMSLKPYVALNDQKAQKAKKHPSRPVIVNGTGGHIPLRKNSIIPVPKAGTDMTTTATISNGIEYANARALLNKMAVMSAIDCKIKIRGNSDFLSDYSTSKSLEEVLNNKTFNQRSLVKLNIRMPSDNTEDPTDNLMSGHVQTEPFWYDGLYYIYEILHEFTEGEFTQELSLIALVTDSEFKEGLEVTPKEPPTISPNLYTDLYGIATRAVDREIEAAQARIDSNYKYGDTSYTEEADKELVASKPFPREDAAAANKLVPGFSKKSPLEQAKIINSNSKAYDALVDKHAHEVSGMPEGITKLYRSGLLPPDNKPPVSTKGK